MVKVIKGWELAIEINPKGMETETYSGTGNVHRLTLRERPKVEHGILKYTHTREGVDGYVEVGISLDIISAYSIMPILEG